MKSVTSRGPGTRRRGCAAAGFLIAVVLVIAGLWVWSVHQKIRRWETRPGLADAPGEFFLAGERTLHVRLLGEENGGREPCLLVHGFDLLGGAQWDAVARDLSRDRRVLVPDLLGFGYSERVREPVPEYSHAGQARLLAQLLDGLGVRRVDVVGTSYGGGVAAQLALDFPGLVRRLVILDGQVYELGGGIFQAMGRLPLGVGAALTWKMLVSPHAASPVSRIQGTTGALQAFNRAPADARVPQDLPLLQQPVLVLWGETDRLFPPEQARRLQEDLPDARLEFVRGAGHSPHRETPEAVCTRVRAFLD